MTTTDRLALAVGRSIAFLLKTVLLIGLFILCAFMIRFFIPETFGIFQIARIVFVATTPIVVFNLIVRFLLPRYFVGSIVLVWLLNTAFVVGYVLVS